MIPVIAENSTLINHKHSTEFYGVCLLFLDANLGFQIPWDSSGSKQQVACTSNCTSI